MQQGSRDEVELDIERLTHGGAAIAHAARQVVFVPYGAPGDRLSAAVVERRAGYLRAAIQHVLVPGADRVLPGCAAFPTCGGCQWQHVAPAAQRAAKHAIVVEQLRRTAGVPSPDVRPTLDAAADWRYRARITLAAEGRRLGYRRARSHRLVEVDDCPIADPAVAAHVVSARAWASRLRVPLDRVSIAAASDGVVLVGTSRSSPGAADVAASEAHLARTASVRGVVLAGRGRRLTAGDPRVRVVLEPGLDLEVPADVFTQVNPAANVLLVQTVLRLVAVGMGANLLDLYCGAGNFTLPLARRGATVLGIERAAVAVETGAANAARHGMAGVTFRQGDAADALAALVPGTFDVVVLDPPRRGAADVLPALAALRAPRIVYVSCDPATLARDVRRLCADGYRLGQVQPIDVFPQTYHIETAAELMLT